MNGRNYMPEDSTLKPGPGQHSPEKVWRCKDKKIERLGSGMAMHASVWFFWKKLLNANNFRNSYDKYFTENRRAESFALFAAVSITPNNSTITRAATLDPSLFQADLHDIAMKEDSRNTCV